MSSEIKEFHFCSDIQTNAMMKNKKTTHPYIPYLLKDIAAAHRNAKEAKLHEPKTIEEELEESERYVFNEREHTLGYYCGPKTDDFPPAEQLSDGDMKKVCKAFNTMLITWNMSVDLPKNLPVLFAYRLTVGSQTLKVK